MATTLVSPDGTEVQADTPVEVTRLKARGYRVQDAGGQPARNKKRTTEPS